VGQVSALKTTVRAQSDDGLKIGGLVIPFGHESFRDRHDECFTPATDLALDWFPSEGRPVLFHHGLDEDLGAAVVGRQTGKTIDEDGVWITAQLDKRSRYVERIRALMAKGALGWSSGAMAHLAKVLDRTGEIVAWPWVEASLTPTPAHPGAFAYRVKSASTALAHIKAVGARPPAALMSSGRATDAELLEVEAEVLVTQLRIAGVLDEPSLPRDLEAQLIVAGVID
jgi:hypothetical protein